MSLSHTLKPSQLSLEEKLQLWQRLPMEKKVEVMKKILDKFIEEARKNPRSAGVKFLVWLRSGDGAIIFPWMFKEKYREIMIDLVYYNLVGIEKLLKSGIPLKK